MSKADERKKKIMKRVQEHYDFLKDKGYEIVFLALQGSQNYDLDIYDSEYTSDIDTKAVVLPSFEDFVYSKEPASKTIVLENNEHIDVKDIRVMFENYKKQNINYLETLFTEFKIINDNYKELIQPLFDSAELIAHLNYNQALRCMAGMSMEKLKALKHPYPTIKDKIEKYGYDPKQLHHILRMNLFIKDYVECKSFKQCLKSTQKEYLIDIKKGILPESKATELAEKTNENTRNIMNFNLLKIESVDKEAIDILNKLKYNLLKEKFKKDLEVK